MFSFTLNGTRRHVRGVSPNTTLLQWLRAKGLVGTKEGCAEGDCGACTVVVREGTQLRAINACLVPLPAIADRELLTVEGLSGEHPAQRAMVEHRGSQCGYCTPGIVMSLVEACHRPELAAGEPLAEQKKDDQLCGNLCRCTGYRPIRDAMDAVAGTLPQDGHAGTAAPLGPLSLSVDGERFLRPTTLPELWPMLEQHPQARLLAGGTDLGLDITQRGVRFSTLISLEALPLRAIRRIGDTWRVGACATLATLESADPVPLLTHMLRFFASRQIKNRATLGGNLCNASPIGDCAPVLMALDAVVVLSSKEGERRVPLQEFFQGYRRTALRSLEILVAVEVTDPSPDTKLGAYKVSRRREMDISAVAAGFAVTVRGDTVQSARLAYGGMAATTLRAHAAEAALVGQPWSMQSIERAIAALDFEPMADHRASIWYRQQLAANLLRGFYLEQERDKPQGPRVGTVQP